MRTGASDFMLEHTFLQTPTVLLVSRLKREQTNAITRKYRAYTDEFVRIIFVSDQNEKDHYQHGIS